MKRLGTGIILALGVAGLAVPGANQSFDESHAGSGVSSAPAEDAVRAIADGVVAVAAEAEREHVQAHK